MFPSRALGSDIDGSSNSATANHPMKNGDAFGDTQRSVHDGVERFCSSQERTDALVAQELELEATATVHMQANAELQRCRERTAELGAVPSSNASELLMFSFSSGCPERSEASSCW